MENIKIKNNLTASLCHQINQLSPSDFPEALWMRARQLFTDAIAVTVAGATKELPPSLLAQNAQFYGGNEQATVIGLGIKTSVYQAALINGASMHVLDYGPMWTPPNHQLSTCLPAVLALAEYTQADGKKILTAMIKGIEMMCYLRAASGQVDLNKVPFHPPGMVGPMGATVAAATILGLNDGQLQNALGIAASQCGSLMANTGTHTKSLHCGKASAIGVEAALLAQKGFTANPDILEAGKGYIEAFFDETSFDYGLMMQYGKDFRTISPGYEIKPFPSNFGTHAAINAGLDLHAQLANRLDKIDTIELTGPDFPYLIRPFPTSGLDGKFSCQYTFISALLNGKVVMDTFQDEKLQSGETINWLRKITFIADKNQTVAIGKASLKAVVTLKDGATFRAEGFSPRSNQFGSELLPFEAHQIKMEDCLNTLFDTTTSKEIIEQCMQIDRLDAPAIQGLMVMLKGRQ